MPNFNFPAPAHSRIFPDNVYASCPGGFLGCSAVSRAVRARHTTQEEGVAVFEGLGLHPLYFAGARRIGEGRGVKKLALNMRQKNRRYSMSVSDGIF